MYVAEDRSMRPVLDGRLTFLSAGGGYRYLYVHVAFRGGERRDVATLAHELQHAVEIAERPEVVDAATLARTYVRIGHMQAASHAGRLVFDTVAAVSVGHRVRRELFQATD